MGKAIHIIANLGLDFGRKRLFLRIRRAGEREILPDHHAQLVAGVVELIGLVNPAAPDTEHIAASIDGLPNALTNTSRVAGAVKEAVVGDPIETFAEDFLAVDFEGETGADGVGGGVERNGAEADVAGPFV